MQQVSGTVHLLMIIRPLSGEDKRFPCVANAVKEKVSDLEKQDDPPTILPLN